MFCFINDLFDHRVDLVEDAHPRQQHPQHGDHHNGRDAETDGDEEGHLHRRPGIDPRERQPHPPHGWAWRRPGRLRHDGRARVGASAHS